MRVRRFIAAAVATASLGPLEGCGGAEQPERPTASRAAPAAPLEPLPSMSLAQMQAKRMAYIPEAPASVAQRVAAQTEEAQLRVEDEQGASPRVFTLAPVTGKGYASLRITMLGRQPGDAASAEPVRPACISATTCEYRLGGDYQVVVDDPDVQLIARDESLALSVRTLRVDKNRAFSIRFLREGQLSSMREVVLLSEPPDTASGLASPRGIGAPKRLTYVNSPS